jgi:phosphatidylinositol 4-kinase
LGNPDTNQLFLRLLDVTLEVVKNATPHPMAREIRFQLILFGLKVLNTNTTMGAIAQYRLKDQILSAGLGWFNAPSRWSFGSNILQLKTEIRLIEDVVAALAETASIGAQSVGPIKSLAQKEMLLVLLLESEHSRLHVWVRPVDVSRPQPAFHHHHHHGGKENQIEVCILSWPQTLFVRPWDCSHLEFYSLQSRLWYGQPGRRVRHWRCTWRADSRIYGSRRKYAGYC